MSSKLRMDQIELDGELDIYVPANSAGVHSKKKSVQEKRKKQDSQNYMYERNMKRRAAESLECH